MRMTMGQIVADDMGANGEMSTEARSSIGILAQRLSFVEAGYQKVDGQLVALNDKLETSSRAQSEKIDSGFRSLDQRLSAQFESMGREFNKQIAAVDEKSTERNTSLSEAVSAMRMPNYQLWIGFGVLVVTLFGTIYGFVSQPINENINRLERMIVEQAAIDRQESTNIRNQMVPRTELDERWRVFERDADKSREMIAALGDKLVTREELNWRSARTAEDRQRTEIALADLRTQMLPRNEWSERNLNRDHDIDNIRNAITREVENLQRQLDSQNAEFQAFSSSLGNGRDVITNLQSELARLRDQLLEIRAGQYQAGPPRPLP